MGLTVEAAKAQWSREARQWVESRPPVVRAIVERMPPGTWWRDKRHGLAIYTPVSYAEDGTVRVYKRDAFGMDHEVFGCDPDNFEWTPLDEDSQLEALWELEKL